jgi:hypothetical protein
MSNDMCPIFDIKYLWIVFKSGFSNMKKRLENQSREWKSQNKN